MRKMSEFAGEADIRGKKDEICTQRWINHMNQTKES